VLVLAAVTALAFVLTIVGADVGASQDTLIRALCAVAVLGAATFTAFAQTRQSQ
jgi:hypothetical protein